MRVDQFDFDLPDDRIALRPARPRDAARCLVVRDGEWRDHGMRDLPDLLDPGDLLIFNDTRVIPAALTGHRRRIQPDGTGSVAKISLNLHKRTGPDSWDAFARPAKRLRRGDVITLSDSLSAVLRAVRPGGEVSLRFDCAGRALDAAIAACGEMPLPPYIGGKRPADAQDRADYQTIFARQEGSVAAPTAALHFTDRLMTALAARGIGHAFVTLHVGAGTFLPVKAEDTQAHKMHAEWGEVGAQTAAAVNAAHAAGRRVVAVGTTALRLLESAADPTGALAPWRGETDIFITPGYRFRTVDALITNFHLPRSTLFMLVAAFCGLQTMHGAYAHAIAAGYRFYSYGDGSLLFRTDAT